MFYLLPLRGVAIAAATALLVGSPAATGAAPQEGERPARRPAAEEDEEPPLLASDGDPALPGRVPADTPEATKEAWETLADTLTVPRPEVPDGTPFSFEIKADARIRDEETGSKDFSARFSYLDGPVGYVAMQYLDDEDRVVSVQMRGPDPKRPTATRRLEYWYRKDRGDGQTEGWINQSGEQFAGDRDTVDRWAIAAYDIARILTPRSMRLTSLRSLAAAEDYDPEVGFLALGDDPGVMLPDVDVLGVQRGGAQKLASLARGLRWLEVRTPDFRLFEDGLTDAQVRMLRTQPKRVAVGIDPETSRPALLIASPSADGPLQAPGSLLMQCTEWFPQTADPEVVLPGRFYAYETVESPTSPTGLAFSGTTTADLFLVDGCKIGAGLTPASFVPED